jgi:endonuclease/exonuclease/phosphatase family metal-dependent hydrolase
METAVKPDVVRLNVITFNVFAGSPIPGVRGGTRALQGSPRLQQQLRELRELGADIVALQEVRGRSPPV